MMSIPGSSTNDGRNTFQIWFRTRELGKHKKLDRGKLVEAGVLRSDISCLQYSFSFYSVTFNLHTLYVSVDVPLYVFIDKNGAYNIWSSPRNIDKASMTREQVANNFKF